MTTKTLDKKTRELEKEVGLLRSFMIGHIAKDSEGEYKPEFVEDVLRALSDNEIEYEFKDTKSFLGHIH